MKTERSSVTKPIPRRARRNNGAFVTAPRNTTSPAIAGSSPASVSSVVVFPAPFGPMSATTSPGSTRRSTSRTTASAPYPAASPRHSSSGPRRVAVDVGHAQRLLRRQLADERLRVAPVVGRLLAQVRGDDGRVVADLGRRALGDLAPEVDHHDPVADPEHELDVVLDEQHGHARLGRRTGGRGRRARSSRCRRARQPVRRATAPTAPTRSPERSRRAAAGRRGARPGGGRGRPRARTRARCSPRSAGAAVAPARPGRGGRRTACARPRRRAGSPRPRSPRRARATGTNAGRPRAARRAGPQARPAIGVPLRSMRPLVGLVKPVRASTIVVLPAPFGPISPTTSRGATRKLTPSTATTAPKRTVRSSISSVAGATALGCDVDELLARRLAAEAQCATCRCPARR